MVNRHFCGSLSLGSAIILENNVSIFVWLFESGEYNGVLSSKIAALWVIWDWFHFLPSVSGTPFSCSVPNPSMLNENAEMRKGLMEQDSICAHCPSRLPSWADKSSAGLKLEADSSSLGTECLGLWQRCLDGPQYQFRSASFMIETPIYRQTGVHRQ